MSPHFYATDIETLEKETEVEFFRSSGPGGQNVNKRETGVRIRHIPSAIVIEATDERSQWQNRQIAFERLQKKLEELNRETSAKPRIPTRIPRREKRKRLIEKRLHGEKKKSRQSPNGELI
ncbi:MAG: peptide chain release factor-like protein [Candidatus Spechtbacteria bacterium]|nr:peptide chain release factor-like protein [Candidatus Spechtbacteria bacterium]